MTSYSLFSKKGPELMEMYSTGVSPTLDPECAKLTWAMHTPPRRTSPFPYPRVHVLDHGTT